MSLLVTTRLLPGLHFYAHRKIKMKPSIRIEKGKGRIGASASRSSNPSFNIVMGPSYVRSFTYTHIPDEFSKRYLKHNGEMILRAENGMTWTVEYKRIATSGQIRTVFLGKCWKPFVIDNELKVGDECIFELIKENGNLLEVFIQRKPSLIEID